MARSSESGPRGHGPAGRALARLADLARLLSAAVLALVTFLGFVAVGLRYGVNMPLPDSYDINRNLLGVVIMLGMAVATYDREHIKVDLLWDYSPRIVQRVMDAFAGLVTFVAMATFAFMMFEKTQTTLRSGLKSADLGLPIWPFYAIAWLGIVASALFAAALLLRALTGEAAASGSSPSPSESA